MSPHGGLLVRPKRVAESSKKGLGGGADSVWVASGIKRDVLFVVRQLDLGAFSD